MKDNSVEQNKKERSEKKVIIFSCFGGGGHMSAAAAIEACLHDYNVKTIDAYGDTLATLDPIYYLTFKRYTGQDFYNFLLRHNKKRITNLFFYFGYLMRNIRKKGIYRSFELSILHEKPDLIVSVIPLVNHFLADIAKKHNIPYFLVPTDLDIQSFVKDVHLSKDVNSVLCLGYDYPEIKKCIEPSFVPASQIKITGFPIRNEFFESKNLIEIKKDLAIDFDKPIVLLVMGATGSTATLSYIQELIKITVPFHLIICIGRSDNLYKPIEKISFPGHITYSIFNGNRDISDAMAIADICITKPGSVTFSEVLYMNIPVIIDNTTPALLWERMNLDMVKNYGLGTIITNSKQIKKTVTSYLIDKELRALTRNNISGLQKNDFGNEFKQLVDATMNY